MDKIENSDFKRLVGTWKTEGKILARDNNPALKIYGTDSYEFILDGHYILHKANVLMGGTKSETLELIQLDDVPGKAKMQYYNSKGESGSMYGLVSGNEFKIEGEGLRFKGTISNDNTHMEGQWQQFVTNVWIDFLEMKFSRISI